MVTTLKPGDVVWAKLKGYRWWPAKIEDELGLSENVVKSKPKKKFTVVPIFFYGSSDYAWLGYDSILPFLDNYDRLSSDSSKPHLFRKSIDDADKYLGRFTGPLEEDFQNTSNLSEVEQLIDQAEVLSTSLKKKRGRPTKTSESDKVKKEIKFNKVSTNHRTKRDKTSIHNGDDSTPVNLLNATDPSRIDCAKSTSSTGEDLEPAENNNLEIAEASVQRKARKNISKSKKIPINSLSPEFSSSDLEKIDGQNGFKKREKSTKKDAPIQNKKRGRPSRFKADAETDKELSKNAEEEYTYLDSHNSVQSTDLINTNEELSKPQSPTKLAPNTLPKIYQINESEAKDSHNKTTNSNLLDDLTGSENDALKSKDYLNIATEPNQESEKENTPNSFTKSNKLKECNSRSSLDTLVNTIPDNILCEERENSYMNQDNNSVKKSLTIIETGHFSSHVPRSSGLLKVSKPTTDMVQLRHELQKFAITEKMKNRSKLESTLSKLESSSPSVDDLMKSKIIKVFRHIIRSKITDSDVKISLQCKNLYKRFKAILDEENDKNDPESHDNSISFNPDTSILTSNSVC